MLIRTPIDIVDNYTQIPNQWLRDERLSLKSRGLLAYILSHAPGWRMTAESMAKANGCGRDAIRAALNELVEFGYLSRSQERERNDKGQLTDYTYTTQNPTSENPTLDFPTLEKPTLENPQHKKNIKKKLNNYLSDTTKANTTNRGTRLTPEWQPSHDLKTWTATHRPDLNIEAIRDEFVDYWIAQPGQRGVKTNWDATWRNWVRRSRNGNNQPKRTATQRNLETYARLFPGTQPQTPPKEITP